MSATTEVRPFDPFLLASLASRDQLCLFLDVDGTLLDIAPSPQSVYVDDRLRDLLLRVRVALGGAVALLSGRPLATVDELFALYTLARSGPRRRRAARRGRAHARAPRGRLAARARPGGAAALGRGDAGRVARGQRAGARDPLPRCARIRMEAAPNRSAMRRAARSRVPRARRQMRRRDQAGRRQQGACNPLRSWASRRSSAASRSSSATT